MNFIDAPVRSTVATALRVVLWLGVALLAFRLVAVALWQTPDPAFHRGLAFVFISAGLAWFRPGWGLVWLVLGVPLLFAAEHFGYLVPTVMFEVNAAAFLIAWILRQVVLNRRFFQESTVMEWIVEIFGVLLVIAMVLGASYPSPANSLDMFLSVPAEYPLSEFEWMNAGQFMLLGCAFFRVGGLVITTTPDFATRLLWLLRFLLVLTTGFFLAQMITRIPAPLSSDGFGLFSPFQSIHMAGAFLLLLTGFFLPLAVQPGRFFGRLIWDRAALVTSLILLATTFAKSAWVGAGAILLVGILLSFRWRTLLIIALAAVGIAFGTRVALTQMPSSGTNAEMRLRNFLWIESWGKQPANEERFAVYENAARLTLAFPLSGVGLGEFRRMQQYLGTTCDKIYSDSPLWKMPHDAHNQPLQISSEMGLPGALVLALAFVLLTAVGLIATGATRCDLICRGAALSLVGVFVFTLFESSLTWRAANVVFWLTAAVAYIRPGRETAPAAVAPSRWMPVVGLVICFAALVSAGFAARALNAVPQYFGFSQWCVESSPGDFLTLREVRFPIVNLPGVRGLEIGLPGHFPPGSATHLRYRTNGGPWKTSILKAGKSLLIPSVPGERMILELSSEAIQSDTALRIGAEKRPYALSIRRITETQEIGTH